MFVLILITIGLSLDSFSLSLAIGLTSKDIKVFKNSLILAISQMMLYLIGRLIYNFLNMEFNIKLHLASIVFFILGLKLLLEFIKGEDFNFKPEDIYKIGILTSIDAFIVGLTGVGNILYLSTLIFVFTLLFTFVGMSLSKKIKNVNLIEKYSLLIAAIIMFTISFFNW